MSDLFFISLLFFHLVLFYTKKPADRALKRARERNEGSVSHPVPYGQKAIVPAHIPQGIVRRQDRRATRNPELRKKLIEEQLRRPKITARKLAQYVFEFIIHLFFFLFNFTIIYLLESRI